MSRPMIGADLLPPWVAQAAHDVLPQAPAASELPAPLRDAPETRQRAFVAGRRAASAALASLVGDRPPAVGIGARGEPLWPSGIVGSITHDADHARCAAAFTRDAIGIGIDVEPRIGRRRAARVRSVIVARGEVADRLWPPAFDAAARVTVAFSAKEALYKCLAPRVGRVFDFLDVAVSQVDADAGRIVLRLRRDLAHGWPGGTLVAGRFALDDARVVTAFLVEPCWLEDR